MHTAELDPLRIRIASAVGSGPTSLAAFDAALRVVGLENYNLIPLSSVIPAGAVLERARLSAPPGEYGDRLYVVLARHETTEIGEEAWAGLGWTQDEFRSSLAAIADGRFDVEPLVTKVVGLDGVADAFEELASPVEHAKILIVP